MDFYVPEDDDIFTAFTRKGIFSCGKTTISCLVEKEVIGGPFRCTYVLADRVEATELNSETRRQFFLKWFNFQRIEG